MLRLMGLDIGEKTIGVAVSDSLGVTAQGVETLERQGKRKVFKQLDSLVKKYAVKEIVVGLPLNMNGTVGPAASRINRFSAELQDALDITVHTWDERLTTVAAERILLQADLSRRKRKKVIDKLAAVLILESYMQNRQKDQYE